MKFSIPKEAFLAELQVLQGIVEKRNTMPILANILMNVSASDIELTGTDLEVGLRTHIGADIEKAGAITVNGKKIFEIVKSLPEGQTVQVELKDETLEIRAGDSEFKILCLAKEDYPQVPDGRFEKGGKRDKDISVIVAKKTLNEIRKFEDETIAFDLDENNLFFKAGPRTLISRIIESKFPNYQAVLPKDNPGRLVISRR